MLCLNFLRGWLALTTAKLAYYTLSRWRPGTGTSLPGRLAMKIAPNILSFLANQPGKVRRLAVTGTNGKTTTSGLLSALLQQHHPEVVHNHLGANMVPGIAAALCQQTDWRGYLPAEAPQVLETDEASLAALTRQYPVDELLVTNLFRDQLDRYGELDTTARMVADAFGGVLQRLWLNADDPLVASLADQAPNPVEVCTYGIRSLPTEARVVLSALDIGPEFPQEVTDCPRCGATLQYHQHHFGHLGHYDCPACGYRRPEPTVVADITAIHPQGIELTVHWVDRSVALKLGLPGLFNAYNLLGALAIAGPEAASQAQAALDAYQGVFGRAEVRTVRGKPVRVLLIKNPVGASEVLRLVAQDPAARVLIAINDNYADGRDISWLWDAPFEWLAALRPGLLWVSGHRAADMAVRLTYGGVDRSGIRLESDLETAIGQALEDLQPGETLYLLPTYTALLALRFLWQKLG